MREKKKFFFFIFKEMYKEKRHGKTPLANRWAADQVGGAKETAKIKVISAWPLIYIYIYKLCVLCIYNLYVLYCFSFFSLFFQMIWWGGCLFDGGNWMMVQTTFVVFLFLLYSSHLWLGSWQVEGRRLSSWQTSIRIFNLYFCFHYIPLFF